ncbi:MAG: heavy-metal-associated domain-containing protein [Burkholderiaceae bacterium]|nr:heavy-metal-associated domain-containing protein [Burkholderiaceae bacterium]
MYSYQVKGMTCGHCVKAVTGAIKEADANAQVRIDLEKGSVEVDSTAASEKLSAAITEAGYEVLATQ